YEQREQEFGSEVMREVERRVVLSVLDRKWREHLYEMDYLREGIGLRGYGQRDPLIEYQRGLRHVQRHDGRDQGRVRRAPVQPGDPGPGEPDRRGGRRGRWHAARRSDWPGPWWRCSW